MIAIASGRSHQAISKRLKSCDPELLKPQFRKARGLGKTAMACASCGKVVWAGYHRADTYCSARCSADDRREISDSEIREAIELRRSGESWTNVQKIMKFTIQGLQSRIWHYLSEQGLLTRDVVYGIWAAPSARWRDRPPSWRWLERKTGLIPS